MSFGLPRAKPAQVQNNPRTRQQDGEGSAQRPVPLAASRYGQGRGRWLDTHTHGDTILRPRQRPRRRLGCNIWFPEHNDIGSEDTHRKIQSQRQTHREADPWAESEGAEGVRPPSLFLSSDSVACHHSQAQARGRVRSCAFTTIFSTTMTPNAGQ